MKTNQKNNKKTQKTPKKNKKTHWAVFFLNPGFFQPCLDHLYDGLAAGGRHQVLVKVGQLLEPGHHLPEQKLVAVMLLHLAGLQKSVFWYRSGCGSGRPKNIRILRIQNTGTFIFITPRR